MIRVAFAILILIHGLIHIMGFAKAYKIAEINQLSQDISKPIGMFWFFAFVLFVFSAVLYLLKLDWWFIVTVIGVLLSQVLIIMYWKDAKFGTLANIIILLVSISAYGNYRFNKMVENEKALLLQNNSIKSMVITSDNLNNLPQTVKRWMQSSGVIGKDKAAFVRLQQVGAMRTKPQSDWLPFKATQYFNVDNPAFVWSTDVDAMFGLNMIGRDKLFDGKGAMLIKVASIIPVVDISNNEKINTGAMIRFLAELCWFPSAALNDYITWETIDSTSVKATLKIEKKSVSGIFKFNSKNEVVSFEADRYFGGEDNAQLEKWVITMEDYKIFDGIKIPHKCKVTWKLKEGDFEWLHLEITSIEHH